MKEGIQYRKFAAILLAACVVVSVPLTVSRHSAHCQMSRAQAAAVSMEEFYKEHWMGAYFKGEKIGYSYRKVTESGDGYRVAEILKVSLRVRGQDKEMQTALDAEIDSRFHIISYKFIMESDTSTEINGRIYGNELSVSIITGGVTSTKTIKLKEPPSLNPFFAWDLLKKGMEPGYRTSMPFFDPGTLGQGTMEVEVLEKDSLMLTGELRDTWKIRGDFKGIESFIWINEQGDIVREESPMGFTLIMETKESAVQAGTPSIDLIYQTAVPFNFKLPKDTSYLKVKLTGASLKRMDINGGRQTLNGDILEIRKEEIVTASSADTGKAQDEFLQETLFVQSKNAAIVSMAKEIIGDEHDRLKETRMIYDWVYKNISKVPVVSLPMATEVLRTRKGDCNEHTILFTALARAVGIPSRIAIGLTYRRGLFYYHAWPEVYLDRWVAVDPTLGQFPADASHIRLLTGDIDKQVQILAVIGKIKLEGIEYQ
jgi:hypothetical protein